MTVNVYRLSSSWDTNTITWNNQLGITGTKISENKLTDSRGKTSGVDSYDVTAWVKAHYAYPSTDYGIRLQPQSIASSTNRACYISSDYANSGSRPVIYISYTPENALQYNQTYYLRNTNSGKYLDVPDGSSTNGTDLIQYYLHGGRNQRFQLNYHSSTGDYSLSPVCATNTAIEITNASSENYAAVQIWATPSSGIMDTQRFRIVADGNGAYRLLSYSSNYTKAVVVYGAETSDSAAIVQYTDNGTANSRWFFEPANKTFKTNDSLTANSGYQREAAAEYAERYAIDPNPNYKYFGDDGGDCTSFVSQCLLNANLSSVPENPSWGISSKSDVTNWFYIRAIASADWYSVSFTSATNFNKHWGQTNMRAYQTIEYASGSEALKDIDFLLWYLKKGDVIQMKKPNTDYFSHTMIIYDDNASCDTSHQGKVGKCNNKDKKELLYAQHSDNALNGHIRALLELYSSTPFTFIKIKKDV